jgi:DMSO/TMAO reductase YedYZ molybdopterin-dependent catalytic subunit
MAMPRFAILENPYNAETPLDRLDGADVRVGDFFVRSHFETPVIDPGQWRCEVGGAVARSLSLDLDSLRALPRRRLAVTLECAGNGRTLLKPAVSGAPWRLGAAGTAEFEGVSLADVLELARPRADGIEVVFRGADEGEVAGGRRVRFERSLPIDVALHPDTLLVWGMGGRRLAPEHGAPVRLIVPRWYAVASVKWLVGVEVRTERFSGWFQGANYVYRGSSVYAEDEPVSRMRVRAIIARPEDGATAARGPVDIAGSAWSGGGAISRVELSLDGGTSWRDARLVPPRSRHAAARWHTRVSIDAAGTLEILARATDAAGNVQPLEAPWNELGYGNNAAQRVRLTIV